MSASTKTANGHTGSLVSVRARTPRGGRGVGLAVAVCVSEAVGADVDSALAMKEHVRGGKATIGRTDSLLAESGRRLGRGVARGQVANALAAAGHTHRLKIMGHLLQGPATYRALQKVTKLQAGPLYHHINKLRLAGLMAPGSRDIYTLTRAGRNMALLASVLGPLVRDRRPRPQPTE